MMDAHIRKLLPEEVIAFFGVVDGLVIQDAADCSDFKISLTRKGITASSLVHWPPQSIAEIQAIAQHLLLLIAQKLVGEL